VEDTKNKRFEIKIDVVVNNKKEVFSFTGPESASLGLVYDASHKVLTEIARVITKKTDEMFKKENKEAKPE